MKVELFAIHTDGGTPMNETAYCGECIDENRDYGYGQLSSADDAPVIPEYRKVAHPERNDTVCNGCGYDPARGYREAMWWVW